MTLGEAADYFKMPRSTLRRLVSSGVIRSLTGRKPHKVDPWSVQEWIATPKRGAPLDLIALLSVRSARLDESVGEHSPDDQHQHGDSCEIENCDD